MQQTKAQLRPSLFKSFKSHLISLKRKSFYLLHESVSRHRKEKLGVLEQSLVSALHDRACVKDVSRYCRSFLPNLVFQRLANGACSAIAWDERSV
jgi:hypothetical protein